jgi:hypothetical protein
VWNFDLKITHFTVVVVPAQEKKNAFETKTSSISFYPDLEKLIQGSFSTRLLKDSRGERVYMATYNGSQELNTSNFKFSKRIAKNLKRELTPLPFDFQCLSSPKWSGRCDDTFFLGGVLVFFCERKIDGIWSFDSFSLENFQHFTKELKV